MSPEPAKQFHFCIDIEGVLKRSNRELSKLFTDKGRPQPGPLVRQWLKLQLAQGKQVLPLSDQPCEGFSYQTGCPGHNLT